MATASLKRNVMNVSDKVEDGSGAVRQVSYPLAALAASASGRGTAAAASSLSIAAGRLETRAPIDNEVPGGATALEQNVTNVSDEVEAGSGAV